MKKSIIELNPIFTNKKVSLKNSILSGLIILLGAACAHHRDVRPGADGTNRVVVNEETQEEASQNAISQANHFCEQFKKLPAIVKEETKYVGSMSEADYKKYKMGAKVAQSVGGAAWVLGGKNESTAGGIVGLGAGIADNALGKGYATEMIFKCQ